MKLLFLFFYIYPVVFALLPLSTRIIYALIGAFIFVYKRFFCLDLLSIWLGLIPIVLCSIIAGVLNFTFDFTFALYAISQIAIFFASYFVVCILFKKVKKDIISNLFKYFVYGVLIQSLLSLLMFSFPNLQSFMYSLIRLNELDYEALDTTQGLRFLGWGTNFFGAGVINGLALIIMVYLFFNNKVHSLGQFTVVYVVILIVGILMARTTMIGFFISVFYLLIWKWKSPYLTRKKIKWLLILATILCFGLFVIFIYIDPKVVMWAFELFINYADRGEMTSASTNRLQEMYIFPTALKTYWIGDGLYNMPTGDYYMETDVGYLRLLYYGGIPVLISYFFYSYWIIKRILLLHTSPSLRIFLYMLFLYILIKNLKGLMDINIFLTLLYCLIYYNLKKDNTLDFSKEKSNSTELCDCLI